MTKTTDQKASAAIKPEAIIEQTSKMTDSARQFVKRSAVSAKERSDNLYEGSTKINSGLEKVLTRAVTGYVGLLGKVAEATHSNVNHALNTAEKLASAKSLSEAAQIQADFVRENATANIDRVREAVNTSREVMMEGVETVRESASKAWPYGKKAA